MLCEGEGTALKMEIGSDIVTSSQLAPLLAWCLEWRHRPHCPKADPVYSYLLKFLSFFCIRNIFACSNFQQNASKSTPNVWFFQFFS